jgi:hypothetical protein
VRLSTVAERTLALSLRPSRIPGPAYRIGRLKIFPGAYDELRPRVVHHPSPQPALAVVLLKMNYAMKARGDGRGFTVLPVWFWPLGPYLGDANYSRGALSCQSTKYIGHFLSG